MRADTTKRRPAARPALPKEPKLQDPKDFRLIGTKVPRLDTPPKIRGTAVFGLDVRVPGMRFAVVARPPVHGGKVAGYDAKAALGVPRVRKVVEVPSGVAVVADSTWAAIQGRETLRARFDPGPNGALDQAAVARLLAEARLEAAPARSEGDLEAALAGAARRIEAVYRLPFLAHATMEPLNATAHVRDGRAEVWAPTQAPTWAQGEVAKALGLPVEKVTLHVTLLGGGFGRKAVPDFPVEAAQVAREAGGPVQVVWTREAEMRHDRYRQDRGQKFKDYVIQFTTDTPVAKRRGWEGYEGMVMFWREFVSVPDELFQRLHIKKLKIDNSAGNWDDCSRQVMESLYLPLVLEQRVSKSEAKGLIGVYKDRRRDKEFSVQYEDGKLTINIFLNVRIRLIRQAEKVFLTEGWHFEVSFEAVGGSSKMSRMRIGGIDVDYLSLVGTVAEKAPT